MSVTASHAAVPGRSAPPLAAGKAPASIIIVRHGARLDAENKDWHLTSSEPYNTPLSYGGWTQTRALGARIASLLHSRDTAAGREDETGQTLGAGSAPGNAFGDLGAQDRKKPAKRRRYKIVLHSSPYLRCIQSSIAIGAGIAQYEGNLIRFENQDSRPPSRSQPLYTPVRSKTLDTISLETNYGQAHRARSPVNSKTTSHSDTETTAIFSRPTLRVDAFLGEWQSPDYYEHMTHPPPSNMMVAGAKAELIRSATHIQGSQLHESFPSRGSTSSESGQQAPEDAEQSSFSLAALGISLPRNEAYNTGASDASANLKSARAQLAADQSPRPIGYVPPNPNYAISTSEPIPEGYVAHARDACIDVDYQWDSMRQPQNWPDGGEYGEEWSALHNRFRKGFIDMLGWYKAYGSRSALDISKEGVSDDDYDELVLVLVTHSAGCNALIGALTNQPVLLDVGMASLTMAVLKDFTVSQRRDSVSQMRRRRSVVDCSQAEDYDVKIVASTDHLRAAGDLLKIPQLQSPPLLPSRPESRRNRGTSLSAALTPVQIQADLERPRSKNTSLGSIRRVRPTPSSSVSSFPGLQDMGSPTEAGSRLWDPRRSSIQSVQSIQEEEVDPLTPERTLTPRDILFRPDRRDTGNTEKSNQSENDVVAELPSPGVAERRASQRGLWGAAPRQDVKRRWTVSDR